MAAEPCGHRAIALSAPLFLWGSTPLANIDAHHPVITQGTSFSLAGRSVKLDPSAVPVRGDLAHIRMAGKVFVPHYVVPEIYRAKVDTAVLTRPEGQSLAQLDAGAAFDVLDIAGGFAWGEVPGGAVGYIAYDQLERMA